MEKLIYSGILMETYWVYCFFQQGYYNTYSINNIITYL